MIRNEKLQRSPGRRAMRMAALGSTSAIGSVIIASSASGAILFLTIMSSVLGGNTSAIKWLKPIFTALSFGTVGASQSTAPTLSAVPQTPVKSAVTETSIASAQKMKLGVNLDFPSEWGGVRAFSNLTLQSGWRLAPANGSWISLPSDKLDRNQNLISLEAGEIAVKGIAPPTSALLGRTVDIICRWQGKARVRTQGQTAQNTRVGANSLTFTFMPSGVSGAVLMISDLDSANPIRNIDCREADADPNAVYDPAFVNEVSHYNTLRFIKWQIAVESNAPVSWANRTLPTSDSYVTADGVPIEQMVLLANLSKANPWFCIPWNADEEYIHKFAEYVRDNLDPALIAYVELSNEVWNGGYAVHHQALAEGTARNLASDYGTIINYRYAQRTGEVMDVWKAVFASNPERIVRVIATQNAVPWGAASTLSYKDTPSKVDALATAPYFDYSFATGEKPGADFFSRVLVDQMDLRLSNSAENKKIATSYGLRFITYEAGQHLTIGSKDDVSMLTQIQRDPRMGNLYTRYLMKWKNEFGDLMMLFSAWGPIGQYGAWGMQEYFGQPLKDAPKAQAVDLFRQSYLLEDNGS